MSDSEFRIETTVATIKKNRGGDVLRISLATIGEAKLFDVRQMFVPEGANQYTPTKKGITAAIRKLDELIEALVAARRKASEIGWLHEDRTAG